jgi:hypothetical protein
LLIGLLLLIVLPVVQWLVVTDREAVRQSLTELVNSVQQGDVSRFSTHVAEQFQAGTVDREQFLDRVESAMNRIRIENAKLKFEEVTVANDNAIVRMRVFCRVIAENDWEPNAISAWEIELAKEDDAWRIISLQPRPTPAFPLSRLEDVLR